MHCGIIRAYPFIPFIFGNPWLTAFHQPGTNRSRSKGSKGCKKRTPESGQDDEFLPSRDGWEMKCTMHTCAKNLPLEMCVDVYLILISHLRCNPPKSFPQAPCILWTLKLMQSPHQIIKKRHGCSVVTRSRVRKTTILDNFESMAKIPKTMGPGARDSYDLTKTRDWV